MLERLGPDLCAPDVDLDAVVERIAMLDPDTELAAALLDQRVAAGIGNVFKSEVCWAERISPFTPVGAIDVPTRRRIYETACGQLTSNLTTGRRTTYGDGLAVYRRAGRRCPRCGGKIASRRDRARRSTYWCPGCQTDSITSPRWMIRCSNRRHSDSSGRRSTRSCSACTTSTAIPRATPGLGPAASLAGRDLGMDFDRS